MSEQGKDLTREIIPPFEDYSEACMALLASCSHAWKSWLLREWSFASEENQKIFVEIFVQKDDGSWKGVRRSVNLSPSKSLDDLFLGKTSLNYRDFSEYKILLNSFRGRERVVSIREKSFLGNFQKVSTKDI